ncbi:MAG: acyl-CoA dehydrogenase [Pseudomonadota bacterium]|nr:acyl-CoA dehydrogenase [Pseudomonadota bacterium]
MYRAPVAEIAWMLKNVAGLGTGAAESRFAHLSPDLLDAVLDEAGRFATERIAPLNPVGDREPARLVDGAVRTPPGWRETYQDWCAAGWNGIAAPEAIGGQGLPIAVSAATQEMWNGACMAFALCPMLTMGAVEALLRHGTDELRRLYLPKIVSGEWTATMNLTEPQAGSDVGALRTRAEPRPDGSFRLFGQKTFITYGDHDLADNIVHMVLARLPDAPAGSRGISLFLVPKILVDADGGLGGRNDLFASGLERKMGIHGAPTCTMIYGDGRYGSEPGATGWLVGEPNRGLNCMFTMMNNARLMVGIEGVGLAERALQAAVAYAGERRQGRAVGWRGEGMSPIAAHPDVRRMLLSMRALTAAARAICYSCASASDIAAWGGEGAWQGRADLLTPVAKAFATDVGFEVPSLGVQVHGGAGYIEETGAAQVLRDTRIAMIYEGTNGIQAVDLVTRKLPAGGGAPLRSYIGELREIAERSRAENRPDFGRIGHRLNAALDDLQAASDWLLARLGAGRTEEALAGATPYLRLFGLAVGGAYLAKGALASLTDTDPQGALRIATARFFAEQLLPQTGALRTSIVEGAEAVLANEAEVLAGGLSAFF